MRGTARTAGECPECDTALVLQVLGALGTRLLDTLAHPVSDGDAGRAERAAAGRAGSAEHPEDLWEEGRAELPPSARAGLKA